MFYDYDPEDDNSNMTYIDAAQNSLAVAGHIATAHTLNVPFDRMLDMSHRTYTDPSLLGSGDALRSVGNFWYGVDSPRPDAGPDLVLGNIYVEYVVELINAQPAPGPVNSNAVRGDGNGVTPGNLIGSNPTLSGVNSAFSQMKNINITEFAQELMSAGATVKNVMDGVAYVFPNQATQFGKTILDMNDGQITAGDLNATDAVLLLGEREYPDYIHAHAYFRGSITLANTDGGARIAVAYSSNVVVANNEGQMIGTFTDTSPHTYDLVRDIVFHRVGSGDIVIWFYLVGGNGLMSDIAALTGSTTSVIRLWPAVNMALTPVFLDGL